MAKPLFSTFADDGTVDSEMTLFKGAETHTLMLTQDLSDDEEEVLFVDDADGAPLQGYVVIEDELISFEARYGKDQILYLRRGQGGTTAAAHLTGETVEIHPRYYLPPVIQNVIIALQEKVNDLQAQIDAL
jgi:hypothetical protein